MKSGCAPCAAIVRRSERKSGLTTVTRCARRRGGGKGKMEESDWFGFFDRIYRRGVDKIYRITKF
jgi:hypothetical protein